MTNIEDELQAISKRQPFLINFLSLATIENEAHLQDIIFCAQELGLMDVVYKDFNFDGGLSGIAPFSPSLDSDLANLESAGIVKDTSNRP